MLRSRFGALWLALLLGPAIAPVASAEDQTSPPAPVVRHTAEEDKLLRQVDRYRGETRRLRRLMGKRLVGVRGEPSDFPSRLEYLRWLRHAWKAQAMTARRQARRPPHLRAWRCIQRHEGSWQDPDPLYYGGLQMDLTFQRMYGRGLLRRKGTADRWTPLEQMWVAERALRQGRGFYPWPVSARRCGLI